MKKFFVPEVVQTSNLDCGPASLKALLEGFGKSVSYGRLREACQTGIDGTSIDSVETVANQLGLAAEQIMLPIDHVLLRESNSLPAIIVTRLPSGLTHFIVIWRRHGHMVQVMDPAIGRRWVTASRLSDELYRHTATVPADGWREFAASDDFCRVLEHRLFAAGIPKSGIVRLVAAARQSNAYQALANLDAAARLLTSLSRAKAVKTGNERLGLLNRLLQMPDLIPDRYWSVRPAPATPEGDDQVFMRGAVLVRVRGLGPEPAKESLGRELAAAIEEQPVNPGLQFLKMLWGSGSLSSSILVTALLAAAAGVVVEAILFRGLLEITGELQLAGQRIAAMAAVLIFSLSLLLFESPILAGFLRLGRQVENRFRIAFLQKLPKLGDRYFHSRLTSDMAERSHSTQRLRNLPDLVSRLLRTVFELCFTASAMVWLDPASAPLVIAAALAAVLPALATKSILTERDLRVRTHAAGLTRFYLDAMLGLVAIRAHSAERSVRREHEKLLGEWAQAALHLQRAVVSVEAVQLVTVFALVAAILLGHSLHDVEIGRVLLIVYWALNIPVQGQQISSLARQYPYYRNLLLRLIDPLGAPEEARSEALLNAADENRPLSIHFADVAVQVSGHTVLENVSLDIQAGSHVAIVGPSGAGKSSLVGILLGWLQPTAGEVLVNSQPLNPDSLRGQTAWVDPAIQLWNQSLYSNLVYGSESDPSAVAGAIDASSLRGVLELLPNGMQTVLGEGGGFVSGGEGQRVRLGRALLRPDARLVILDEPFRGLDRERRRTLLRRAREHWRDATLICITHDIDETQSFDRVVVIESGRVAETGPPAELTSNPHSRYMQLLDAEEDVRHAIWAGDFWRRIRVHSGRIVEEHSHAQPQEETTLYRTEVA